jgi:spectinomycin phosphotransferase
MRARPADVSERQLTDALASAWGLLADRLRYVPEGGGSHHWRAELTDGAGYFLTVDDLTSKPWLGAEPESAFAGLRAAFDTALALGGLARLPFVVPPVPAGDGATVHRLTWRYSLAVFRFVDGRPGSWGDQVGPAERDLLLRLIAELHLATPVASGAVTRGLDLHYREGLESALAELRLPWTAGPYAELARRELAANEAEVRAMLAAYDDYAARLSRGNANLVLTHGEPHPGNLIRTGGRYALIDWDTVALALPERDLWMLDDGSADGLAAYREATGRAADYTAIAFYRLAWTMTDLAAFTCLLRSEHERDADTERASRSLGLTLRPDSAVQHGPYRHVPR